MLLLQHVDILFLIFRVLLLLTIVLVYLLLFYNLDYSNQCYSTNAMHFDIYYLHKYGDVLFYFVCIHMFCHKLDIEV